MGRTNPTFRNLLEAVKGRWAAYRRALRRRDTPHFDRLFEHADAHADAAGYLNCEEPMYPILLSMLLEHEKRLAELEIADADAGADNRVGDGVGDGDGGNPVDAATDGPADAATDATTDATTDDVTADDRPQTDDPPG